MIFLCHSSVSGEASAIAWDMEPPTDVCYSCPVARVENEMVGVQERSAARTAASPRHPAEFEQG